MKTNILADTQYTLNRLYQYRNPQFPLMACDI